MHILEEKISEIGESNYCIQNLNEKFKLNLKMQIEKNNNVETRKKKKKTYERIKKAKS